MKNIFFYLLLCSSLFSDAQTQQNINKNTGTVSNAISNIDSIRFTGSSSIMEVVLENGTIESHSISDILNANFTLSNQNSCDVTDVLNPNLNYGSMTDQEGTIYKTIVIGNQEWMAENLKTSVYRNGDAIANVTDNAQWHELTTAAWCSYYNDSQFECPFGKLYNWYVIADPRNVCPTGWHVPTDDEWNILLVTLDPQTDITAIGPQYSNAGAKLKSEGTQYWTSPNEFANNESGFSALPAGARNYGIGEFYNGVLESSTTGNSAAWWSSTMIGPTASWYRNLSHSTADVWRGGALGQMGFSVRCIKN
jgi:uncharacterized protein (TIGR02145 family)